ncbi:MAG: glutamine synthetase [Candidatus Nitrosocosmicus sp.]|nr:glutamine synthetase [Candidatus Nitrosocosmicus sp.]
MCKRCKNYRKTRLRGLPRLDGSSIKGFKEIYESDMLLKPDPSTFAILPEYFDKNNHNKKNYAYPSMAACIC